MLAESWEVSDDLRTINLHLRKGVTWHSGRDFTSDDVKANMLSVRDPKNLGASNFANQSNWFTGIETPDKYTVILRSDEPRPAVFDFFEYFNMTEDQGSASGPPTTAVGTGPFSLVEWVQGDHLTFARNNNYWQTGRPYLDSVDVRIIRDQEAQATALESGALDVVKSPSLSTFVRYKNDPNYQTLIQPISGQFMQGGFNVTAAPFDNKVVRQAFSYAIDRKRITEVVYLGTEIPLSLPWPESSPAYDASKRNFFTFDLDKARSLLNQTGVSNISLDVTLNPSSPELRQVAEIYQADLAKIGVTANIRQPERAAFLDEVNTRKYQGLFISSSNWGHLEPITMFAQARSYNPTGNNSGFSSEAYTQLVTQAGAEPDVLKRKQLYSQINDLLLDQSFTAVINSSRPRLATRAGVHDVGFTLHEGFTYTDVWMS
jgi:peptide/nickel transport system substrate-binding protein